jgi:hypothetical protein
VVVDMVVVSILMPQVILVQPMELAAVAVVTVVVTIPIILEAMDILV